MKENNNTTQGLKNMNQRLKKLLEIKYPLWEGTNHYAYIDMHGEKYYLVYDGWVLETGTEEHIESVIDLWIHIAGIEANGDMDSIEVLCNEEVANV
ncbi:MAG: hypothetical protein Q4B26_06725 [Eubacteriales bacterium]|nr:hypothetical protein [Eubacteriales bacterium]